MTRSYPRYAYYGHHKSASSWVHTIVGHVCDETGMRCSYLANEGMFDGDLRAWVERDRSDFLCYVNADWEHVRHLPEHRGFHIVRDPRDILTSAYFSHLHSHKTDAWPELVDHRKRLEEVTKDEGLILEMDFNSDVFAEMDGWNYEQENVLELKMEEFTPDPLNGFLEVFRFLGFLDESHYSKKKQARWLVTSAANVLHRHGKLPLQRPATSLPAERLLGIVHDNRFDTKAGGRKAGEEQTTSHYRKGVAGDWVNHFGPEHVEAFKERYNPLLLKLGYEREADWSLPSPA